MTEIGFASKTWYKGKRKLHYRRTDEDSKTLCGRAVMPHHTLRHTDLHATCKTCRRMHRKAGNRKEGGLV